ncbi:MAG: hypothetical protein QGH15_20535 [Kiritimatiellia bacterium]|jgi:hypothetical protein|nr:hypothetical protein [Kiritimatiellia bacterium]
MDIDKEMLCDPSEEVVAVLKDEKEDSMMVLTQKTLYEKGKILQRTHSGAFKAGNGLKMVPLKEITGTAVSDEKSTGLLMAGFFMLAFCLVNVAGLRSGEDILAFLSLMGLILVLSSAVVCIVIALVRQKSVFIVEHGGGATAMNCGAASKEAVLAFQKKVMLARE